MEKVECFVHLLLLLLLDVVIGGPLQQLTFYNNLYCSEGEGKKNETFTGSNLSFSGTWPSNAKSVMVVGFWRVRATPYLQMTDVKPEIWSAYPPDGMCVDLENPATHIIQAERIGPSDMHSPQVVFFTGKNQTGEAVTLAGDRKYFSDDDELFTMKSAVQFAANGWIIFTDTLYRGKTYCFCSWGKWNGTYITLPFVKYNLTLKFGSAKYDHHNICHCGSNSWRQSIIHVIALLLVVPLHSL